MLQKLNERIQGIIAWVVIILIAVTFTLFGIDYYMQSHQDTSIQVEVNGQPITKQAFELSYQRTRQFSEPAQITATSESELKKQVLNDMMLNTVSVQSAQKSGFEVSSDQANSAILNIPQFQEDGHFSQDRYQQALTGALFTPETFQREVRQGMLLNQQRFAFIGTAFALPSEVTRFVRLYMQTRDYSYLPIPAFPFMKQVTVSEEEIKNYYQQHKKQFMAPEKVSIEFVRLSMRDIKEKIQVSDEEIKSYYDENQNNYLTPTQWQVAHILFAVPTDASEEEQQQTQQKAEQVYQLLQQKPELFEEQVKLHSSDKISVMNKGILPWIIAGQSEFDKVLITMDKLGQISAPTKSRHGYEIFKLVGYKPSAIKPFSEVKQEIKEQMLTEQVQTKYTQALEQLSDLSYQTPDSLAPVADALKLQIEQAEPFSRQGGNHAITQNKQVINAAFSHDVLELGNNSEPIQIDNDSVIVLRLNKHIPAAEKTLAEVHGMIADKLAKEKAEAQATKLGKILLSGKDVLQQEKLIEENHLQWQSVAEATRETDKAPEAVNELAFNLARAGAHAGRKMANGDYVIVQLKRINDGKVEALDKEQVASITQQLEASYGVMDYDLYVNGLLKEAKIVKH
ncbi:SurA N-terminal domain-containing protein [Legionella septentrionalis]|uniref:SurA N-terminal domain-containing protein n=1 Tax=Legionella septentrionalis TaxID=2498109 RepID=UPI000F8F0378|nr:SurA N-terminal domain-containing protein [Legionella septentrionalis]RUR17371.1 peptidylprolyl isomerase [Legionella septentrionalis]